MNFVFSLLIEMYLYVRCPVCSFSHIPYLGEHCLSNDPNPSPTPTQHCPKILEYLSPYYVFTHHLLDLSITTSLVQTLSL